MPPFKIKLPKGKYISDIEPFKTHGIPNNSKGHKELAGCGITNREITYPRHSIGILPNVPVIMGKVAEHNRAHPATEHILGVYKGIDVDDIKSYLLGPAVYKKILTTPEGFMTKVLKAFEDDPQVMYNNYFLLYDECERIITDVSYRGAVAAPLDEFFKFTNKAMVSATTLPFTDERFGDLMHYNIVPTYDYSKPITVLSTNNVIASLQRKVEQLKSEHVCIFINSTNAISVIVKKLGIESKSKAYCAQDSVVKLLSNGYRHGSSELNVREMKQYNLFTSRYFSAVDIKLDYKPDIIMVSDVLFANHSILDPHTEIIQIAGRFRNGVNSLTHITNFNPNLESKTEDETRYYLEGCFYTYDLFVDQYEKSIHPGSKDMFKNAIETIPVSNFYQGGKINKAMIDNAIHEERVKGYYQNITNLQQAYHEVADHFTTTHIEEKYPIGDSDFLKLQSTQTKREKSRTVARLFEQWTSTIDHYVFTPIEMLNKLTSDYPKIAEAHRLIGLAGLEGTDYVASKIAKAVKAAKDLAQLKDLAPIVYEVFEEHHTYTNEYILDQLTRIYQAKGITTQVRVSFIGKFFIVRRSTLQGVHVFTLHTKVF